MATPSSCRCGPTRRHQAQTARPAIAAIGSAAIDTTSDLAAIVRTLRAAGCVFAEDEAAELVGSAGTPEALADMVARRVEGLPLEHILGWVEFCGLRVAIDPGVFVPRRRTEQLAHRAAALAGLARDPTVVDLACGCGAVGIAVASLIGAGAGGDARGTGRAGGVALHAVDIQPAAVACASRNLRPVGGRVYQGDLFAPLPIDLRGRVDVLVANVPYVPSAAVETMPPEARVHEPRVALDGGTDGLDVLRRVAGTARDWLAPGGYVLMEVGEDQLRTALAALASGGLHPSAEGDDDLAATIVIGAA
jgi:release factor glutamine methyltransferase